MVEITEQNGKRFATLPNGNQVQIENEIINDSNWADVETTVKLLGVGDRQVRNLAEKHSWQKKYAYINKKPVTYYYKQQIESYMRDKVTEVTSAATIQAEEPAAQEEGQPSKSLMTQEALKDIDHVVKKLQPYIGDFLETYKKNQERIITLEEKKSDAEKTSVFWKTTALWIAAGGAIAFAAWFKADHLNSSLNKSTGDLSSKYQDTQKELYDTKILLTQKEDELARLQPAQTNSQSVNAASPERK